MLPEKENMSRGSGYKYLFTVFTPTYNRAYTLKRVYDSLQAQTFRDFEWLIVDDGSTDNTAELVQEWQSEAGFPIRYVKKSNGGKHTAINLGVPLAEGELFLIFDSDDACFPDALEKLAHYWNTIDLSERDDFAAVTGWCVDINGNPLCTPFPSDIFDATALDIRRYGAKGEYWGFTRTSVMKQYPFPELAGETFCTESIVWNRIARRYKTRFINEPLQIKQHMPDSLVASYRKQQIRSPKTHRTYYYESLQYDSLSYEQVLKHTIQYVRFSLHTRISLFDIVAQSPRPLVTGVLLPFGMYFFVRDRVRD